MYILSVTSFYGGSIPMKLVSYCHFSMGKQKQGGTNDLPLAIQRSSDPWPPALSFLSQSHPVFFKVDVDVI